MANGLDDVVAAETVLSDVDGLGGRLTIRGHSLPELAGRWNYAQVMRLLLDGFFNDLPDDAQLTRTLGQARADVFERLLPSLPSLAPLDVYSAMRAGMAQLPDGETLTDALLLIAAPAVLTPALLRLRRGEAPIAPDSRTDHAADMLRMLGGRVASPALTKALDTYLVTVCDHGLNASTFATRVVASTQAGLTSSVLAGLGALKGPLHGGAPGPVIEMLDAIQAHGDAAGWLRNEIAQGRRIMGFGHRIYRVRDPRADVLKAVVRQLGGEGETGRRLAFAETVEQTALEVLRIAKPQRSLQTNVEFYTALVLQAAGFPPQAFSNVFAAGRVAGWIAHAREQQTTGRLIRPQSRYIGPVPDLVA
ncbi:MULTISPECIES: citrate synthase/methylcitrate synthase [unclassified Mesorhizobium]|uniref:citrate synthase/methylcitrate synthase n=1 Tax=unclassified Mesorhizobium TaxID=325217 RepID=UPI000FCA1D55|nr:MULTISPECIES: citrate synthase/methylcitrate synthase [unclassified Mesorhizobium]RUZ92492.1 citrate synthase/methylcitrate synthase [Mesorhizobium sp. M7A.F.Ca.US.003.02.2.1]RUZ00605.1 citrate synthase/methylcitrate synthase [Mesorhizobium sp. M7A.F.Ca.CA.001.12.2.1]RUZ25864.1 citrate synthase/methylcitrate synthase [Mesorhizobium sp. M7A.F.Ca.US.007.01.2.1]RUZ46981.1 citrate synthase/methylcitrate synthase [Mesorhizobium sp. M7A.F.Ca.US.003.02.1.1]RUZ65504.1 citrate synthase/methylcitrate